MKRGRTCPRCVEGKLGMGGPCPDCAGTGYADKADQARYMLEAPERRSPARIDPKRVKITITDDDGTVHELQPTSMADLDF